MTLSLTAELQQWPVRRPFRIAYHTFHHRDLLRVEISDGQHTGVGEAGGHPQLEPLPEAQARLFDYAPRLAGGTTRADVLRELPAGPARNALDCALWDLEAKSRGERVWDLAGLPGAKPVTTAYTIGLRALPDMVAEAEALADFRLLKLKVDGESGFDLLEAIANARPDASFIIDANEAWTFEQLAALTERAAELRVVLIEQPLPKDEDAQLEAFTSPVPLAADESFHTAADVPRLRNRYQVINIKLDKTGGLTAALEAARAAEAAGMALMVGCNGGTSLGIAPAYCVALLCRYVDLDSPLLLARDREPGLRYQDGQVLPPAAGIWG